MPYDGMSTGLQRYFPDMQADEVQTFEFSFSAALRLGKFFLSVGVAEVKDPDLEVHDYVMLDFVHNALPFARVPKSQQFAGLVDMKSKLLSISAAS